jgi:hypothetical protein
MDAPVGETLEALSELLRREEGAAAAQGVVALDDRLGTATGVVPPPHGGRGPVNAPLQWLEQQRAEAAEQRGAVPDDAALQQRFLQLSVQARRTIVQQHGGKRKALHGNSNLAKVAKVGGDAKAGERVSVLFAAAAASAAAAAASGRPRRASAARGFAAGAFEGMDEDCGEKCSSFLCVSRCA